MALERGELDRAAHFLPAAVRADPNDAAVHHSLGLLFRAGGKPRDAVVAFRAAVQRDPRHVAALNGLGLSLLDVGDAAGAESAFAAALQGQPGHAETIHNLGLALERQGRAAEAEQRYREAVAAKPDLLPSRYALARVLLERDAASESEAHLRACLEARPDWPDARAALAMAVEAQWRDDEAEAILRAAPDASHPAIAVNLANLLARRKRYGEAVALYRDMHGRLPREPLLRHNLGNALAGEGRVDEAIEAWREAIALAPAFRDPRFALARWLLARGEHGEGWAQFAWRPLELPDWLPRTGLARADGAGTVDRVRAERSVEVVEEMGLGDVVFFLQWSRWLRAQGVDVLVRVSPRLGALLGRVAGLRLRDDRAAPLGVDRAALPMADLPRLVMLMGGPGAAPGSLGIEPLPERLQAARQALAEAGPAPYTGLTWRAGVTRRSVGRDMLAKETDPELLWRHLGVPGTLVALQRDARPGELDAVKRFAPCVADFSEWTQDLEVLLGLLAALDGYAGVSNTNMHLLGMLGRHATVAVPNPPEWRWAGEGDSPWFPGFRVVRQRPGEGWDAAFARSAVA